MRWPEICHNKSTAHTHTHLSTAPIFGCKSHQMCTNNTPKISKCEIIYKHNGSINIVARTHFSHSFARSPFHSFRFVFIVYFLLLWISVSLSVCDTFKNIFLRSQMLCVCESLFSSCSSLNWFTIATKVNTTVWYCYGQRMELYRQTTTSQSQFMSNMDDIHIRRVTVLYLFSFIGIYCAVCALSRLMDMHIEICLNIFQLHWHSIRSVTIVGYSFTVSLPSLRIHFITKWNATIDAKSTSRITVVLRNLENLFHWSDALVAKMDILPTGKERERTYRLHNWQFNAIYTYVRTHPHFSPITDCYRLLLGLFWLRNTRARYHVIVSIVHLY